MADDREEKTFSTQEGPRKQPRGKPQWEDKEPASDPPKPEKK